MKTYHVTYNDSYTKRQFIVAAHDQAEAEAEAYASECGEMLDGTKYYPEASDFTVVELVGCFNRQKQAGIIQRIKQD